MQVEYDRDGGLFQGLATTVSFLIGLMLQGGDVLLHSVTQRCKSSKSLAAKLAKPEKEYRCLTLPITVLRHFNDEALLTHAGGVPPKRSALYGVFYRPMPVRTKTT